MLLLLIILITLLVFLLFLCSSSLILYYLNMAWLCRVTVFWLFWNLSAEKCTPTETNSVMDETFEFFFSTERNVLSAEPQKKNKNKNKARLFSWWTPAPPAPHPPKEATLYRWEREVLYLQQRWLFCLYNMGFEIFQTFQKPESQVSYLPTCSLTTVRFWFWKKEKKSN